MRTVPFISILNWLARRMLGSEANLTTEFARPYVDMINTAVRDAWEREFWPEWTLIEQRFYRAAWTAGTFAIGAEVYHTGTYWRALASTTDEPSATSANWQECGLDSVPPLDPYIALAQPGFPAIGTPRAATEYDPRDCAGTAHLGIGLSADGVQVRASARRYPSVWLEYRLPPPVFTSDVWSSATAYAAGARVYLPSAGECYLALLGSTNVTPGSDATKWQLIGFPYVLAEFVKKAAYAEALLDDGQHDKASVQEDMAEDALADEWTKAEGQVGVIRTFGVLTRHSRTRHFPARCS